ncbi:MAG: hypothetical protein QGG40_03735 [Myxococcota bacterium]|nr:hypothetical protein [Myxococcota bacterium]
MKSILALGLLSGCGQTLDGDEGFEVVSAFINVCVDSGGDTVAMVTLEGSGLCGRVLSSRSQCEMTQTAVEEEPLVCDGSVGSRSSNSDDALYTGMTIGDDGEIDGLVFESADRYSCQEKNEDGHWTGDHRILTGAITLSTVSSDAAILDIDLEDLTGSLDVEVCR